MSAGPTRQRLISVTLDEASIGHGTPDQEHERRIAIYDLVEINSFGVPDHDGGPYCLHVAMRDKKLLLDVRDEAGAPVIARRHHPKDPFDPGEELLEGRGGLDGLADLGHVGLDAGLGGAKTGLLGLGKQRTGEVDGGHAFICQGRALLTSGHRR